LTARFHLRVDMKEQKRIERRRSVRAHLTIPVKYRLFETGAISKKSYTHGHTNDISVDGLKLAVRQHHPVGTKLDMEIDFPPTLGIHTSAKVIGQVVGGGNWKIGDVVDRFDRVSFVDADKKAQILILRLVFEVMKRSEVKKK